MHVPATRPREKRRLAVRAIPIALSLALLTIPAPAAESTDREPPRRSVLQESVSVTATRLPSEPDPVEELPAHVTVIEREQIERSGVRTLQDLLAFEAGAVVYDQVGNDIQKTFDLRGFTGGTGTKVYLDGAPLNDTRNNGLALDLVPLAALERVEIARGSAGASAGGGSEAGLIHLRTRRGDGLGGSVAVEAGSFDTTRATGDLHGAQGRFDFLVSGMTEDTDGFRQNAGGDRDQWTGAAGIDLGADRRLELSVVHSTSDLGNPGALNAEEIDEEPDDYSFNVADFSAQRWTQASLSFRGTLTGPFTIAANVLRRSRDDEILTTGRLAADFGGFFADLDASAIGSTVQVTHNHRSERAENHLSIGLEWLEGETDALGRFTSPDDPGTVDPSVVSSLNTTDRRTVAVFIQDSWRPTSNLGLTAGIRFDDDRVGYRETVPDPTLQDSKSFEEVSLRAGVTWSPARRHGFYASYGESFLPPTVEQLFSFPLFGSNDALVPEDSTTYEFGLRGNYGREFRLQLAILRVDTENEILFVADPDPFAMRFGANENVGKTRREGVELSLRGRPLDDLALFANLTLLGSEFRNGDDSGNEVPLTPGLRFATGIDLDLPLGLAVRTDLIHVGEQVLDGDEANVLDKLDAYTVVNARLTWSAARSPAVAATKSGGLSLFVEARNLFDERYATRGIFSSFLGDEFFIPAPGRRYLVGARWTI